MKERKKKVLKTTRTRNTIRLKRKRATMMETEVMVECLELVALRRIMKLMMQVWMMMKTEVSMETMRKGKKRKAKIKVKQ